MNTLIYDIRALNPETIRRAQVMREADAMAEVEQAMAHVEEAARVLAGGGLVVFPTETVYGIGANAFDEGAVRRVYEAKGRPSDNPMIVHISRASDIGALTPMLSPQIVKLADNFWPGPLTMVLEKKQSVPSAVTGGLETVAVRLPDDFAAAELIRLAGCPVAAPSANLSGSPSPTKAEHAIADMDGRVDIILAGGDCRVGIESTVVDMTVVPPEILRPGILTADMLSAAIDEAVEYDPALHVRAGGQGGLGDVSGGPAGTDAGGLGDSPGSGVAAPKSPGMKYRHYAPNAEMIVVEGRRDKVEAEVERLKKLNEKIGNKVGVILFEEQAYIEAAHGFYARLRELDAGGADLIIAGALSDKDGVGFAVMNRMMKSAGYNIVKV
ncbi:MAG: threonylcarbamoyl-AMP synthase [Clostridiales Family XIII bacterium]|jgi:L-threonylcarbamoyladenylate synthase|nr:threonylcarbamoyl-AMP synthase [Clostridiales Family XIII bacterium]